MKSEDPENLAEQPFLDHVVELRSRLIKSISFIFLIFLPIYYFSDDLFLAASAPLMNLMPDGSQMIATQVASPFLAPFKRDFKGGRFQGPFKGDFTAGF